MRNVCCTCECVTWQGCRTPIDYEISLIWEEQAKYSLAIEAQQKLLRRLVDSLAQSIAVTRLQCLLERHNVDRSATEMLCGKVAALKCLWCKEMPQEWVTQPAPAAPVTTEQSCSCCIDELQDAMAGSNIPVDHTGSGKCRQADRAVLVYKTGCDTSARGIRHR